MGTAGYAVLNCTMGGVMSITGRKGLLIEKERQHMEGAD